MTRKSNITGLSTMSKVLMLAILCFTAATGQVAAKKKVGKATTAVENTCSTADFAYPKTVADNARKVVADVNADAIAKLDAAVQLTMADNMVEPSTVKVRCATLDSLANALQFPYNNLAYLLEATLYNDIYNSDSWKFSQRHLPMSKFPVDPMEWSGDMFAVKVMELVGKATENLDGLQKVSISEIEPLLKRRLFLCSDGLPTVAAFVVNNSLNLLAGFDSADDEMLPLRSDDSAPETGSRVKAMQADLYDRILKLTRDAGQLGSTVGFMVSYGNWFNDDAYDYFLSNYKSMGMSAETLPLLLSASDKVYPGSRVSDREKVEAERKREIYGLLKEAEAHISKAQCRGSLEREICQYEKKEAGVRVADRYLTGDSIKVSVESVNINRVMLHLYRIPRNLSDWDVSVNNVMQQGELVRTMSADVSGVVPFSGSASVIFPPQSAGRYAVLASTGKNASSIPTDLRKQRVAIFIVSGIETVGSESTKVANESRLYVVNSKNFAPVEGAKVTFKAYAGDKHAVTAYSNKDGYVDMPEGNYSYTAEYGKHYTTGYSYLSVYENRNEYNNSRCEVFTDLSLYHPGDTVNFAGILYKLKKRSGSLLPGRKLKAVLQGANGQRLDTLECIADKDARFNGRFILPAGNSMLGRWNLIIFDNDDFAGQTRIEVAEYKTPTFFVELGDIKDEYEVGDVVTITGKAQTYSGMPVANADVDYHIEYISWWLGSDKYYSPFGATTTTDANGNFEIRIPTEKLKSTSCARGAYLVRATAVSSAGETQAASPVRFMLGKAYMLDTSVIPDKIALNGKDIELNVPLCNALGNQVRQTVVYSFKHNGKSVLQGSGVTPSITVDGKKLKPGKYDLVIVADSLSTWSVPVILYSPDENMLPYKAVLWVPETKIVAADGQMSVEVKYGSSFKGNKILCEVYDCEGFISRRWLDATGKIETVKVDAPSADNRVFVLFRTMNNLDYEEQIVSLLPASIRNNLKIKVNTFRDKIAPGSREKWSFTLLYNDSAAPAMPMMAVMTDKALNSIAPFEWSLNLRDCFYYHTPVSFSGVDVGKSSASYSFSVCKSANDSYLPFPQWSFYGKSLYTGAGDRYSSQFYASRSVVAKSPKKESLSDSADDAIFEEMSVESVPSMAAGIVNDSMAVKSEGGSVTDNVEMSEPEHPLAFFYPSLTTDEAGNVEISFVTPAYSTTWQLQLLGYTPELYSTVAKYDAVSAKPVMVKANLPRFLRTGDNVSLTATLMNNTGRECPVSGVAEIFNPATGDVIKRAEFAAQTLDSGQSRVVAIDFDTPADMTLAGVRFYAISGDYSDGEQSLVAVLPSSSPVIESEQFYLDANTKVFETKVPEIDADATVTLEYCDNPVWYTLTALPSIAKPESESVLVKANALYGNVLANDIARRFPQARTAVSYWKQGLVTGADSTLVSNLSKNASLKSIALDYTPWVNDAAAETSRMQQLDRLLDSKRSQDIIAQLAGELVKLQKPDGGWSWVSDMKSSLFITMSVLERVSMLRRLGCSDFALSKEVIDRAVNYCDRELYDSYIKADKKINTGSAVRWLYIRNMLAAESRKDNIRSYHAALLKNVIGNWRSLDIYGKAQAAVVLDDARRNSVAQNVVESLRQYAVNKPGLGMYYDNIGSGFNGMSRLVTTAKVLEAFSAVAPASECVAGLRQWLILQRQTLDWGNGNSTPEVVLAILGSGVNWLDATSSPDIRIEGEPVIATADRYTGNLTLTLTPGQVSGKTISITRDASGPAWGGVLSQYVAPIESVTAQKSQHLSITKQIYSVDNTATGTQLAESQLTPGQRVRVVLTISNDTDLQYVAVTDERGATLEPAEQLASYYASDGVWIYREPLNDKTLLLMDFLPKGKHIVTYDCYVSLCGDFSLGIATAQSQYAPLVTAHSAGNSIIVKQDKDRR